MLNPLRLLAPEFLAPKTRHLFGMKAAALAFTTIINEINIFNYLFPAFTWLSGCAAKGTAVGVN